MQPLQRAKKLKSKIIDFISTPRKALKSISRKRPSEGAPILDDCLGDQYLELIKVTQDTTKAIQMLLIQAEGSRKAFLDAAVMAMEPVVQSLAQSLGYSIEDKFQDGVLLSRTFTMPVLSAKRNC